MTSTDLTGLNRASALSWTRHTSRPSTSRRSWRARPWPTHSFAQLRRIDPSFIPLRAAAVSRSIHLSPCGRGWLILRGAFSLIDGLLHVGERGTERVIVSGVLGEPLLEPAVDCGVLIRLQLSGCRQHRDVAVRVPNRRRGRVADENGAD